ncbi:uncharacterized protein Hap1MRO34_019146 isoform 4-T4 [Clarias gariepinus]|uniref:uncharacterized protein LOC128505573 isoform X5 n=1 Tax=Clarias gariepinus TaxID=13013 RepID=UPI00234C429A|nr:uncharacterized protein LOC128505573 isoform X5 [Clarias gariepinus]
MFLAKHWILVYSFWTLLPFFSAVRTWNCCHFNSTQIVYQGLSTTINCYPKQDCFLINRNQFTAFTIVLRRNSSLCAYFYFNKSWTKQMCKDNIRLVWIPETEEISFDLLNVQINHSGIYTCTVDEYIPPPTRCVLIQRTFIHVVASPSVSVACIRGSDGAPTMLCAAEGFYPADLKQSWLTDGEYISYLNTSLTPTYDENLTSFHASRNYSKNRDGSYDVTSYLHPSRTITVYYCWVNHSGLSKPILVNISSAQCTERKEAFTGLFVRYMVVGILFGLLVVTALFIEVYYQHLTTSARHLWSTADANATSEPVSNHQVYQHELKQTYPL